MGNKKLLMMSGWIRRFLAALFFATLLMPFQTVFATHQRAAEIIYRHLSGLTYEITLISYTFTPSPANAYRDFLSINWGDGTITDIPRVVVTYLPDDITYNKYVGQHTFPGPSTYIISCEDPNRNGGIINIPNSINTPLFIYSELMISPFIGGYNNSPVLLIPPVDNACVDQPFYHNPGAFDADGDSLSYRLVPCRGAQGKVIPGYSYPAATNKLSLDSITGDLLWDSPKQQGEFNIAILIEEWRNGVKIGSVLRDMQIIVVACNNHPPIIDPIADTCIEAGKNLRFQVKAWDPDSNNVTLTGNGGPLILSLNPASMEPNPATGKGHTQALFRWNTICGHIRKNPYQVIFKAKDNGSPVSLVTLRSMNILVVGPAPENLTATPLGNTITLNWDPYTCPNATGFDIYRKADSTGFIPGYCETGVPPYLGYKRIASVTDKSVTTYLDDNNGTGLQRGLNYCYLVVAIYPDRAESYASNEACATLKKDVPVITNVSITETNVATGTIYLAWSKPTETDTIQAPGPYKYLISRSRSDFPGSFVLIDSLYNLNDTLYNDGLLNTLTYGYSYRIDYYNVTPGNRFLIGSSQSASSMFLNLTPTDRAMILGWTNDVPWMNQRFIIMRQDPGSSSFDSVGQSAVPQYLDKGLVNGESYCYKIRSIGKYSAGGYVEPIVNLSQETCAIPEDNIPPCPPLLSVKTICDQAENELSWKKPADSCPEDIAKYYIYYTPLQGSPVLIDSVADPHDSIYLHKPGQSVVGCYAVAARDSTGNLSEQGNIVCVDYTACPVFKLPNIFTPNDDGYNDKFRPVDYSSVEKIDLKIMNRWGRVVFKTQDPEIDWDGRDESTNQPCSDGTYFYVCEVYQFTLSGIVTFSLHGSVTILR